MGAPTAVTECESGPVRTGTGTRPLLSPPVELLFKDASPVNSTRQPFSVPGGDNFGDSGDAFRCCWFTSSEETDVANG